MRDLIRDPRSKPADKWDTICISLSALSIICIPLIVRRFKSRLEKHNVNIPEEEATSGWFGLAMFIHGILDLATDGYFCFSLFWCRGRYLLGASFLCNLMLAALTTWYLSFRIVFPTIERNQPAAREWHIKHNKMVTAVIIASACRIESLAILRLRLRWSGRDRLLWCFPIEDKHFHFLQYSGWFHAILADVPHLVAAVALLVDKAPAGDNCHEWYCECSSSAALSIFFSSGSIIWGTLSAAAQPLRTASSGRRESSHNKSRNRRPHCGGVLG